MMSKKKSIILLIVFGLIAIVLGVACFASFAIPGSIYDYNSVFSNISKGIDLEGGYYAVLKPDEDQDVSDENLDSVIETLRTRLDSQGYTEATITKQDVTSLRIEIPNVDNSDKILELIGSTGELTFRDSAGTVYLTGSDIADAYAAYDNDGKPLVIMEFTSNGQKKFATATETIAAMDTNTMGIYLDEEAVSTPKVNEKIDSPRAEIEGIEDFDMAKNIASIIKSGSLGIKFVVGETRQISASLGEGVLNKALLAAGIGILLIFAILIFFYRGMGISASCALVVYVILYTIVLAIFPFVQLTFPGIAGIILSIGMAVDANVIIFERIKEEYGSGKTVEASIKIGFKRAFVTVLDSNVTTLIAAIVLWIFCSGSIQGFAITLFLGVLVSMFTAILVTRGFLKIMRPLGGENEEKFLGLRRRMEA